MIRLLLLPFCCDGYDEARLREQIASFRVFLEEQGFQVTASEPIRSFETARKAAKTYHPYRYDLPVLFPVTWSDPSLACTSARAFFGRPIVIRGLNEFRLDGARTEFSSVPAALALAGCLREMDVPCELLTGDLSEESERQRLHAAASAAAALNGLRTARIGCCGFHFNGITAAGLDLSLLRKRFGTEVIAFDGSQLIRRLESLDLHAPAFARAERLYERAGIRGLSPAYREKVLRMTAALREIAREQDLDALLIRCHTEFSVDYGLSLCLPLSLLGDEITVACEADLPVLLTELILRLLSGGRTVSYADVRTITPERMDLGACGMCPAGLTGKSIRAGGTGGYFTNASGITGGPMTLARLLKGPGGTWTLHALTGEAKDPEEPLREYGCPPYPMISFFPRGGTQSFAEKAGANHYAFLFGDWLPELKVFCRFAGISLC